MWELIRINKRNSILLLLTMAAALLTLGYIVGMALDSYVFQDRQPYDPYPHRSGISGGLWGMAAAAGIYLLLTAVSFSSGDRILLAASGAKPVTHDNFPQLFNVVEEMKIAAGLPAMPKVYVIPDPSPNAFATGRNASNASVAVTAGLLAKLDRDQLQGVVAHEISHILHRDVMFVTLAGIMLGSMLLLSQVFLRGMFYGSMGGSRRRYSSGGGGGQGQLVMMVVAIICAVLAPVLARLLYLALSRKREYLADAGAVRLTRYPEGLAGALEKIASDPSPQLASVSKATAPMYIVNPFKKGPTLADLTSTHPPISERIRILRSITAGASLADYSAAYTRTTHHPTVLPASAIGGEAVEMRKASAESKPQSAARRQALQVGDLMRKVNGFTFLACDCGLKMKIPPNYRRDRVKCPRCGKVSAPAAGRQSN